MNLELDNAHRIYQVVAAIPFGKVISYGEVAQLAGLPRAARLVGHTLKKLPADSQLPWHRVVNHQGQLSTHSKEQQQRLVAEGILFTPSGRIDLKRYGWHP